MNAVARQNLEARDIRINETGQRLDHVESILVRFITDDIVGCDMGIHVFAKEGYNHDRNLETMVPA